MKKNIFLLVFAIMGYTSHAQTGIGTLTPHASSALDISLANKGVLLSRVALKGTTDTSTIPSPANSLLVYNTATTNDITQGYYYWSTMSSRWIRVIDTASIVPAWSLTGNNNTIAGTNFIGTLDNQDLVFKRNNIQAGRLAVSNTSFGLSALKSNVGGSPNTAIGNEALESNINGYYNTATGYQTLNKSTESSGNTAFGHVVLGKLVKGDYNVGVGMHSLKDLKEGAHNLAIGAGALNYMTGSSYNIGIGSGAGAKLYVGGNLDGFNTIIGSYDNYTTQGLLSGKNNTIIGSRISSMSSLSNNIIIADGEGNRRINVNELGNVGLGTTSSPHASAVLHIGSRNKGVLLPQVALTSTTDITTIPSAANSLLIYNTAVRSDVTQGYYYWNTSKWIRLLDSSIPLDKPLPAWNLTGNSNTVAGENFIGTRDNQDLVFKRNDILAGRLAVSNTSFGLSALKSNATGNPNTAIGNEALENNTRGYYNTATGYQTLNKSTESSGNTAFGHVVLGKLVKGNYNVGVGMHSLKDLEEGAHNLAIGAGALNYMTGSSYNIGIGSGAGAKLYVGGNLDGFNTIIGSYDNYTTQGLLSGKNNTIIGSRISSMSSLSNNIIIADGEGNRRINVNELGNVGLGTTSSPHASAVLHIGSRNKGVLLPQVALTSTTDITTIPSAANSLLIYNTAVRSDVTQGYYYWNISKWIRVADAMENWSITGNANTNPGTHFIGTTDDKNLIFKRNNVNSGLITTKSVALGYMALNPYSADVANSAFGALALSENSNGTHNSAFGASALELNTAGYDNSAFGATALRSNKTGTNNVAVGSNSLFANASGGLNSAVGFSSMKENTEGSFNSAFGYNALSNNKKGIYNTAIGTNTLLDNVDGSYNTAIGAEAGVSTGNLTNTIAIGKGTKVSVSNTVRFGNAAITSITGQVAFSATSDRRYKDHIVGIPLGLNFVNKLNPVEYIRKNNTSNTKEWGFIAQELEQTLQEENYKDAGIVQDDGSADKMLSVRYTDLIAPMVKAMQELTEHNEFLNNRINQLEAKLEKLSK